MALGIVWGMACVMVLLAVANGFEASSESNCDGENTSYGSWKVE